MIVHSETLVSKIVKNFIEAAGDGTFKVGEKLPIQDDLQKMFGVSRNTMREALQRLESLGVVTIRHGDGTYLNNVDVKSSLNNLVPLLKLNNTDLTELMESRKVLEVWTAQLAALRSNENDIKELRQILGKMEKSLSNLEDYTEQDAILHLTIARCAKNSILAEFVGIISDLMKAQQVEIAKIQHMPAISYAYHCDLVQAIAEGDSRKAAAIMNEHLENAYQRLSKRVGKEKQPDIIEDYSKTETINPDKSEIKEER